MVCGYRFPWVRGVHWSGACKLREGRLYSLRMVANPSPSEPENNFMTANSQRKAWCDFCTPGCLYVHVCITWYICMYVCIYMYACIHLYTYRYICIYIPAYMYVYSHIFEFMFWSVRFRFRCEDLAILWNRNTYIASTVSDCRIKYPYARYITELHASVRFSDSHRIPVVWKVYSRASLEFAFLVRKERTNWKGGPRQQEGIRWNHNGHHNFARIYVAHRLSSFRAFNNSQCSTLFFVFAENLGNASKNIFLIND